MDESIVSWAACLLADASLAALAHDVVARAGCSVGVGGLRRLAHPGTHDTHAAVLLRHPDLLDVVASLHRAQLAALLAAENTAAA
ncbi:hypothetical protein [Kitasatospora paranensis]|uniref:Uncharacterized protein n=1 Tax=Kitasatospora paranensis TaxID=258053 RepID=A0ABW2G9N5_9ACTN